jgi:predicted secreted protein
MAQRELRSNDVLLFIGETEGVYDTVICLTSNSITRTTAEITTSTKCGPSTAPGAQTNSISFEGNIMVDPDTDSISAVQLINWWTDQTVIYFKMGVVEPSIGDFTYFGSGFISALSETYALDAAATFSGTISPDGLVSITTATS